jgi:hypothetical protein
MDIHHPWTKYEIARVRDEERLLRARAAMRSREVRDVPATELGSDAPQASISLLERIRRRKVLAGGAAAGSGP